MAFCVDCKKDPRQDLHLERLHFLVCKSHMVCDKCLGKRGTALDCKVCCDRGIWIFIDNSNIWIGAKKIMNAKRHFTSPQDHRVRIDTGSLCDIISHGRHIVEGTVYGSKPPELDTVWKKCREQGLKVTIHARSLVSGKSMCRWQSM